MLPHSIASIKNWITPSLDTQEHEAIAEMNPHHLKPKEIYQLSDMVTAKQPLQGTQMSFPFVISTFTINLQCGS